MVQVFLNTKEMLVCNVKLFEVEDFNLFDNGTAMHHKLKYGLSFSFMYDMWNIIKPFNTIYYSKHNSDDNGSLDISLHYCFTGIFNAQFNS